MALMTGEILTAGFLAVKEYIATHVLTCLVPAFFLAGAMVTLVDRDAVPSVLADEDRSTAVVADD